MSPTDTTPHAAGGGPVSPERVLAALTAYQKTAALKGALDLDLFSALHDGPLPAPALASRCGATARGVRSLCDYLVVDGFLAKRGDAYGLTAESAAFLDRASPGYLGGAARFLLSPALVGAFGDVAATVRRGGTVLAGDGTVDAENPVWVEFARGMMPMMAPTAEAVAAIAPVPPKSKVAVLDVAAGPGAFGIALARRHPSVEVTALDWPQVLAVARENARAAGVERRFRALPGNAFEVDWGRGYDVVLLPNFLHHFDPPTCERLLRTARESLAEGGALVTVEFVPDPDRAAPPPAAQFSLVMLCSTPSGDAYTFAELEGMLRRAGFSDNQLREIPPSPQRVIVSRAGC